MANSLLSPSKAARGAALAMAFLTRLPVSPKESTGEDLGRSVGWFPLAGWALGALVAGASVLLRGHLPLPLVAVLLVVLHAWATGGLHLDGWADLGDGLGGGRGDRNRMLQIMRDSRIGAFGASALFLLLATKIAALFELVSRGDLWTMLLFPVIARWTVVPLVLFFPYARPEGLGKSFNGHAGKAELALATVLAAGAAGAGVGAIAPTAAALFASLALGAIVYRRLGGLTGDCYGAAIEFSEVAFLVASLVRR